ncbi:hypothetical protein [Litoribrevibacter albus]|uniref:Uncharacterized protein n=1 Tax=Litoribrevibacter albus TaxID=1473156 RepID=A0AA37SCA3_9GAMM|nr:hypothetical protein [Litoribrevibacter albus]GLQ32001.1 hypothetical protein GCM10007876_24800 [Litoribrevibacter albus]
MWESDFDESVYKSAPFIRKGEFEKGIYTTADSDLHKGTCDLAILQKLAPLTENSWGTDIEVLNHMQFKTIHTASRYNLLFKMLNKKRADFILLEFSSESTTLAHRDPSGDLYPVEGIKVVFPFSRHFMVSKKHSHGQRIYNALQKGLKILRKNGTIEKALYQSKLKLERVKDWKVIYPQQDN